MPKISLGPQSFRTRGAPWVGSAERLREWVLEFIFSLPCQFSELTVDVFHAAPGVDGADPGLLYPPERRDEARDTCETKGQNTPLFKETLKMAFLAHEISLSPRCKIEVDTPIAINSAAAGLVIAKRSCSRSR